MIYILMIWTAVAASDSRGGPMKAYHDWRPLGEFHMVDQGRTKTAQEMCENAAKQLGLNAQNYRCVRSR